MLTSKKPCLFSKIPTQENKINLNETIKDLGYKIDVIANEIYSLAGGMEQKKIFLRNPKKKNNKEKPKKNLVEIFNEKAKRKRIIGPYLRGTYKIDDHIKLLKNILIDDEGMRQDFIKKKKRQEEVLKRLDENFLRNQEIRKKAKELSIKEDISIKSSDLTEGLQSFRESFTKRTGIFNFYRQFSGIVPENNLSNKGERNSNRKNSKSLGTLKIVNGLSDIKINSVFSGLDRNGHVETTSNNNAFKNNNNNFIPNRRLSIISKGDDKAPNVIKNLTLKKNGVNPNNTNNFFSSSDKTRNSETLFKANSSNFETNDNLNKFPARGNIIRQTVVFKNSNIKMNNFSNNLISPEIIPLNKPPNFSFYNNFSVMKLKEASINNELNNPRYRNNSNNSLPDESNMENDNFGNKYNLDSTKKIFKFDDYSPKFNTEQEHLNLNFSRKNDLVYNENLYSTNTLLDNDLFTTLSPENNKYVSHTGLNFFNNFTSPKRDLIGNNASSNFLSSNNLNHVQYSRMNKQNLNPINISNTENSELNQNTIISTTNRLITTKNHTNKSILDKTFKKQIQDKIANVCTDTSNKALAIKSIIENYSPINNKIIKKLKNIDNKFLKPVLEKEIEKENKEFKKSKGFFIYPKSLLDPVYVSDKDKNVLRESNYVDKLNETKAFAARNLIFNKYKVYINNKDLYNYKNDLRPEKTHKDNIDSFKKDKVRNNSWNIKKMIFNTNAIKREINERFEEMKSNKIVSGSVNRKLTVM